ncbi:MAG: hypothetical protein ABIA37_03190 [Candidatus Woesearchaeota archaeon]
MKKAILIIGIFVLVNLVSAQELAFDENTDWSKVDFNTLSSADWSKIDQSQVPAQYINQIPANRLNLDDFYGGNLLLGQIKEKLGKLTYEQISYQGNIDKIKDIKDLNPTILNQYVNNKYNNAQLDIKSGSCIQGCTIVKGILKNGATGKSVTLSNYGSGTKFSLLTDKAGTIQATVQGGTEIKNIPATDAVTIILPEGSEQGVKLPQGVSLTKGELNYQDGEAGVDKSKQVQLLYNGRRLDLNTQLNGVKIYFDKVPSNPEKNYLAWTDNDLVASGSGFQVEIAEKSGFFNQEKTNPALLQGSKVVLQPKTGKIMFNFAGAKPKVNIEGEAVVINGKYNLDFRDGRLFSNLYHFKADLVAGMDLTYQGKTTNIEDGGKITYGRTKHFQMAWTGDVQKDVDTISKDLKLLKNTETKRLVVWLETDIKNSEEERVFDGSKEIAQRIIGERAVFIPIKFSELSQENNQLLLERLAQEKNAEILAFGHSYATIDYKRVADTYLREWNTYSDIIPENQRGDAKSILNSISTGQTSGFTEEQSKQLLKLVGDAHEDYTGKSKSKLYEENAKAYVLTSDFNSQKTAPVSYNDISLIGCGTTQLSIGRDMTYPESIIATITKSYEIANNGKKVNYANLKEMLRTGTYQLPDRQSAVEMENYLNTYSGEGILTKRKEAGFAGFRDWCVSAPGKRCA